jgi:hypothetical protein
MKKSKTFTEAVLASVAAVALVGLTYVSGSEKTVDLKATNTHDITMISTSTFNPKSTSFTRVTDVNLGLSNGGYLMVGFSGDGDSVNPAPNSNLNWLISSTQSNKSTKLTCSLTIDIFANNLTAGSFTWETNCASPTTIDKEIFLFAANYTNYSSSESPLSTQTGTTADFSKTAETVNHIRYFISETETSAPGFTLDISSISFSFTC